MASLTQLMCEIDKHFTFLGKLWLAVFLFFQIVFFAVVGDSLIFDKQSSFMCDSYEPGRQTVCFNAFPPLSHVHFWVFHTLLTAAPTVMFLGYVTYKIPRSWRSWTSGEEDHGMYIQQLLAWLVSEVWGLVIQYILYGFEVAPIYECDLSPCLHKVPCFVSRPTEKTILLWIMYAVSSICLSLTLLESLHLAFICCIRCTSSGKKTKQRNLDQIEESGHSITFVRY